MSLILPLDNYETARFGMSEGFLSYCATCNLKYFDGGAFIYFPWEEGVQHIKYYCHNHFPYWSKSK
jgi:hypothetical protein